MAAYWIAHVQVLDAEKYSGYTALAPAAFAKYGAKFLARGGRSVVLEGDLPDRHVVIEFADLETAQACYASPEYQQARARREGHCIASVVIVEG
ncbi:DUF1330 domain-containing protein [Stenotrophomonas sp. SAU14A_NAIMI4_5]|uniref:DUF1330 domain-containing protein n=1 Tax=Stenotrophomonas sp. SAU14A_NAIMI4_5 TaxID=2072413 RepID=UPI000D53CEFB|nr:DUF1330 domain-containing protein [Stenotrophomonas sp. SAU14A_NAIMI4_5]AWH47681.1 DUF1330 domain-containing protein [Stenotrophomonas sp. SAU14A_NAIMI4_5]